MTRPPKPRRIRVAPVWRAALLPVAIAVSVTMILLGVVDATKTARRLPPQIAYIPVESRILAVSSSLNSLWRNLGSHLARLSSPAPESFWAEVNTSLREISARCIAFDTPDDLRAAGLDPDHGISVALVGNRQLDFLGSLPVTDRETALATIGALFMSPVPVWLASPDPTASVAAFRITPQHVENGVLCAVPDDAPFSQGAQILTQTRDIPVPAAMATGAGITLYFAPRGPGPARIALTCEALMQDGSTGPCDCEIDYGPCNWPFVSENHGTGLVPVPVRSGAPDPGPDPVWRSEDGLFFGFVENRLLAATRADLIRQADGRQQERRARLLGDNALLTLIDQFHSGAGAGDATILGLFRGIEEPVASAVPFAVNAGRDQVEIRSVLPLDTFRVKVLDQLISTRVATPPDTRAAAPLAMLVNDPALGTYFNVADRLYGEWSDVVASELDDGLNTDARASETPSPACGAPAPDQRTASLYDGLGNFAPVVAGLTALDRVGPLQGYLLDVRDGVPEIVLVQHGLHSTTADTLILETQSEMKRARDSRILCQARARFWAENGGAAFPVYPPTLIPYLADEVDSLTKTYNLQAADFTLLTPAPFDAALFETPQYRADAPGQDIRYLPPPFTDNDLRYLVAADEAENVDETALRQNAFRLAFARRSDGAVVFGTDARTVQSFLNQPPQPVPPAGDTVPRDKLFMGGNPEHLVTLALLYPDEDVRSLVTTRGFEILDQYRDFRLSLRPARGFDGLFLDLRLAHD